MHTPDSSSQICCLPFGSIWCKSAGKASPVSMRIDVFARCGHWHIFPVRMSPLVKWIAYKGSVRAVPQWLKYNAKRCFFGGSPHSLIPFPVAHFQSTLKYNNRILGIPNHRKRQTKTRKEWYWSFQSLSYTIYYLFGFCLQMHCWKSVFVGENILTLCPHRTEAVDKSFGKGMDTTIRHRSTFNVYMYYVSPLIFQ